jgi:hypothetical protein
MVHREGDIHVTAEDHIEWPKLIDRVHASGLKVTRSAEYLNYDARKPMELWTRYRDSGCTNMRFLVARKEGHGSHDLRRDPHLQPS